MQKEKMAESKETTPGTSFELFGQLPPDIRQGIWREACSMATSTPGVCFFEETWERKGPEEVLRLIVHEPHNRHVLGTNTEAHDMALRSGGTTRAYNPDTDIVYIPDKFFHHFMNRVRNHDASALTNKIRHVAISFTHTTIHVGFARDLACISSLETVSVVYPGPTGTFKHNTAVEIPADRGTPLRRLTEEELGGITINADYIYSTWAGDCPVSWTHSGPQDMEMTERMFNSECGPEKARFYGASPLWDYKAKRLRIRYEARCFQPLPAREMFCSHSSN